MHSAGLARTCAASTYTKRVVVGLLAGQLLLVDVLTQTGRGAAPVPQAPTFRAGIDIARVTVRVLDKERRPVRDLAEKDFTVLVHGVPTPIVAFSAEDAVGPIAPAAAWRRDVAPDVAANSLSNPRLVVIIVDDGLIPPDPWVLQTAKAIARKTVDQLGPSDLASIVFTKDNRAPRDFTADRARLLATIDRTMYGFDRRNVEERTYATLRSWSTMRRAVEYLASVPDLRSLVIYVTIGTPDPLEQKAPKMSGLGTTDLPDSEAAINLDSSLGSTLASAHAAGIPVYAVSPLGLVAPSPPYDGGPVFQKHVLGAGVSKRDANGMSAMLRGISNATGGRAIVDHNAPADLVPEVFEENSLHYTLGYEAPGAMADGRYRRIEVRVNRPGVTVEPGGERMFLSPKPSTAPPAPHTTRALSGLVPLADETLRLAVAAMADPMAPGTGVVPASVALALGVDLPVASSEAGDEIAIEVRVFDGEGRKQVDARQQTFRVAPASGTRDRYFDFLSTLSLKPGRYNLRISAHSQARDRSGSVHTDLTIPDYARAPLSVSDVVVTAPLARTATPARILEGLLPVAPTTARAFAKSDRPGAFVRVYWGRTSRAGAVIMAATITDTENRHVLTRDTPIAVPAVQGTGLRSADYRLDLPLQDLVPGEYLLTLRARPATGAQLVRHVRFSVR